MVPALLQLLWIFGGLSSFPFIKVGVSSDCILCDITSGYQNTALCFLFIQCNDPSPASFFALFALLSKHLLMFCRSFVSL